MEGSPVKALSKPMAGLAFLPITSRPDLFSAVLLRITIIDHPHITSAQKWQAW